VTNLALTGWGCYTHAPIRTNPEFCLDLFTEYTERSKGRWGALIWVFFSWFSSFLNALLASASHMNLPIMAFDEGYAQLFGDDHLVVHKDRKTVHLSLDETY
jgi:hypothetical protein